MDNHFTKVRQTLLAAASIGIVIAIPVAVDIAIVIVTDVILALVLADQLVTLVVENPELGEI